MTQKITKNFLIALAVITAAVYLLYTFNIIDVERVEEAANTTEQTETQTTEQQQTNATEQQELQTDEKPEQQPEIPDTSVNLDGFELAITEVSQANGLVTLRSSVADAEKGNCFFNFTSTDTRPVTRSAKSVMENEAQLCNIDINEVEFTKLGDWTVEVVFSNSEGSLRETTNVTIQ